MASKIRKSLLPAAVLAAGLAFLAVVALAAADEDYEIILGYYNCDHMTAGPIGEMAGIYKDMGLKVRVVGNAKVPEAMAAGQMDVGYVGTERMMRASLKGAPIFVAANNHLGGAYYLVTTKDITEPKQLPGKKLALGTDPDKTSSEWVTFAKDSGIPADPKAYQVFAMTDQAEYLALKTGNLDGYLACDPWASMAEFEDTGRVMKRFTKLPSTNDWGTCCVFAMNKNFAKEHPVLAVKIIKAHARSLEFIYTHPKRAAEMFAKAYAVPEEVAMMTIWKKTVAEERTLTWAVDRKRFQDEIDYNISIGTLEGMPPVNEFINTEFLDKAQLPDFETFIREKVDPVFPLGLAYPEWKAKALAVDGVAS